jgi:hypothetical protein
LEERIKLVKLGITLFKTIMLPVVLYGCQTGSLTLREEHRWRMSENRLLRRILRSKRDKLTRGWRKLHNVHLHTLHSSLNIIRMIKSKRMSLAGHLARMGEMRNGYKVWL